MDDGRFERFVHHQLGLTARTAASYRAALHRAEKIVGLELGGEVDLVDFRRRLRTKARAADVPDGSVSNLVAAVDAFARFIDANGLSAEAEATGR
ncbi:hypothetical protein [Acuticoccus sp.]|uniref:hypothetical protein n=1 Tax=Acuticoccus sp. TaxID=1904378 RepID=UPI003B52C906